MPVETVRHLITQRRLERQRDAARHLPDLFVGERPLYAESLPTQGTVLTGLPSSPGRVTGLPVCCTHPRRAHASSLARFWLPLD